MAKPKLIVFDLDCTMWPFHLEVHPDPPFKKRSDGTIVDSRGWRIKLYPDVPQILDQLKSEGYIMAAASRTEAPEAGHQLIKILDWEKYLTYREIYPGQKTTHFQQFHKKTGIPYSEMLFFDDEPRNIRDVSRMGVTCKLAYDGMSAQVLKEGLAEFAKRHS